MKKMLLVVGMLVTFFCNFQLVAIAKDAQLVSEEGYRITFNYDVEQIDGNGRGINYTLMKNLHVGIYHNNVYDTNNQHPGTINIYWYRTCNFDPNGSSSVFFQQTYPLEWRYSRGFGYYLEATIFEAQTLAFSFPGEANKSCEWTQEIELQVLDKKLTDPVNHSTRFKINFNY